jgi:hypothetical protein
MTTVMRQTTLDENQYASGSHVNQPEPNREPVADLDPAHNEKENPVDPDDELERAWASDSEHEGEELKLI